MNLGTALSDQGKFEEAVACQRRASELRPLDPQPHLNLGLVLHQQGRAAKSIASYHEALRLRSDHPEVHFNLGAALLLQGDFAAGWPEYDWRLRCKNFALRNAGKPLWDGSPLADQVLLLHAEQGLGDTLQFIRFVPQVQARAETHRWSLRCRFSAAAARSRSRATRAWCTRGADTLLRSDVQSCRLLTLPGIFGTTLESIPAEVPYLSAGAERVEFWRAKLPEWPGLRVGIMWQGNPEYEFDRLRSIPLVEFAPLAEVSGVRLLSLQKYEGLDQLAALGDRFSVVDLGAQFGSERRASGHGRRDVDPRPGHHVRHGGCSFGWRFGSASLDGRGRGARVALASRARPQPLVSDDAAVSPTAATATGAKYSRESPRNLAVSPRPGKRVKINRRRAR